MSADSDLLRDLAAREAIRQCLYRYSRGVDRLDADMVRSAYWPDIEAHQLDFVGNAEAFLDWSFPKVELMDVMAHQIGNVLIELDGDEAVVESCYLSYRRADAGGGSRQDGLTGGRYLDRFECRDGEWRIAKRRVVIDWSRDFSNPDDLANKKQELDRRRPDDPSYAWFGSR